MFDTDAWRNADADRLRPFGRMNRQRTASEIRSIVAAGNSQSQSELPRTIGELLDSRCRRPADAHPRDARHRFQRPNQNASGESLGLGDNIQAFVHSIDEIHVGVAGRAEDHAGSGSNAPPRMRGAVLKAALRAKICLCFDDAAGSCSVHHDGSQQRSRDFDSRTVVERARQRRSYITFQLCR